MAFLKSLRNLRGPTLSSKETEPELQIGGELLQQYELYWTSIHQRTAALGGGVRWTESELSALCDAAVRVTGDWQRLKGELEGIQGVEQSIASLCDSIARLSVKFDRLEQSLGVCLSNRELQLSAQFTAKRDGQLDRQRAQHQKATAQLRHQLETATRAAAASYRQATNVDPPLLHPQPLPNAAVATSYGSAQLGAVVPEVRPIQITKFRMHKAKADSQSDVQHSSAAAEETQPLKEPQEEEKKDSATAASAVVPAAQAGDGDAGQESTAATGHG